MRKVTLTKQTSEGEQDMTRAEKEAMKAYERDLVKQGIDKQIAEVMAKSFVEAGIIKPVVNSTK